MSAETQEVKLTRSALDRVDEILRSLGDRIEDEAARIAQRRGTDLVTVRIMEDAAIVISQSKWSEL